MSHGGSTCTCGTMHHRAACIPLHTTHHFMPPRMSILAHPPFKKTMRFHAANYRSVYPTHASQLSALSTLAMLRCTIILTHLVPCFTSPQSPHPCLNNRTHNVPPRSPHSPDRAFRTPPAHIFQTSSHTLTPAAHVFFRVKILLHTKVTRYLDFLSIDGSFVTQAGVPYKVRTRVQARVWPLL